MTHPSSEPTNPRQSIGRKVILLLAVVGFGAFGVAASCDKEKGGEEKPSVEAPKPDAANGAQGAAKTPEAPKPAEATDDAPGPDTYPDFAGFAMLEPAERKQFKAIAEAEVCPCPDSTVSLHVCLAKKELRCQISERAAVIIAVNLKQKMKQTDILNEVAKFVESSKKVHTFEFSDTPVKGNKDAKVVFVEFADFQCPHCRMASKVMDDLVKKRGKDFAFYYKQFPLSSHPEAFNASKAALAAHKQGKFWPMHDMIFENQMKLTEDMYTDFAKQLGLNLAAFKKDYTDEATAKQVERDRGEGEAAQITGTPTIYVNGRQYFGEKSVEALEKELDGLLAEGTK